MKQKLRQPLSILLTLLMLLALLPAAAFAADGGDGTENPYAHEDHTGYTEWTDTGALPDKEGEYYLSNDITLSANWDVPGETVLCLNGHNVDLNTYHFEVGEGEHLVICDCSTAVHQGYLNPERYYLWTPGEGGGESCDLTGGVIYGGVSAQGYIGSCINSNGGDVTLAGGNIAGNLHVDEANLNASNMNGAVYVYDGDFTMYGGSVTGNYSLSRGGGVHVTGAKQNNKSQIKLYGGEISHNIADYFAGGIYVGNNCDFLLDGAAIEYNTAGFTRSDAFAGGIYITGGYNTATIKSGSVCYNTCKGSGAGLYLDGSGYADREFFKMTGGLIKGNSVDKAYDYAGDGGGIGANGGKIVITGGTIVENTAKGEGGGIRTKNCNLTIGAAVTIGGNTAGKGGSDIYYNPSPYGGTTLKLAKPQNDGDAERYWFDDTPEQRYEGNESSVKKYNGSINSKEVKYLIAATGIPAYAIDVDPLEHGSITADPSGEVAANTEVTLTITPAKGYELKEGSLKVTYVSDDGEQTVTVTGNKFTMPAADVSVSAEFEAIKYTITYNLDGGDNAEGNPTSYTVEDAITLSVPTKDGYTFTGWTWGDQTTPEKNVTLTAGSVTGNLTFTAHWQENPPTPPEKYTVTVVNSHADTTGADDYEKGAEVTIYAGEYEGYTFAGWTVTSDNVTLVDSTDATTTFTMPAANVTVTANWTEAEEPEPAPAGAITVTPADIIIYMGGDKGYEGVVDGEGNIVGSNSLPEPGFVFELPDELDGVDVEDIEFKNADGSKTWKVELYEGLDGVAERKLYTIVPTYEEPEPIRVVFTDGDTTIVSDNFTVGLELNKTFGMKLYTEPAGEIIATYEGKTYSVVTGSGKLTVRGTTGEVEIVTVDTEAPESGVGVVAEAGTTYTINGSEVKVEDASGVALLFDEIIEHSGSDRTGQLEDKAADYLGSPSYRHEYAYEFKYLDLVDTNNGNAWVAASKDVTVYWPLPANADAASLKVLHFEGLHRSNENGGAPDVNDANVTRVENVRIENGYVIFEVGSAGFSPFALVWEEKLPDVPDVPVIDPDDDDDDDEPGTVTPDDTGVSDWLDTKNHIQYLSGYGEGKFGPEDNMTRAQAAQMFYNLLLDKDVAITVSFSDVAENAWYAEAVNTLASLGIVDGVGGGLYAPERAITRAEFTVIAMRFAHLDTSGENIFSDVSRSDWFYDQVVGSVKYGWINGYADGTFRPNNTITRAEVTTIVNRMLGRSADREYVDANIGSLTQFNDISGAHWAYYEVMEAANAHDYAIVNGKEDWK